MLKTLPGWCAFSVSNAFLCSVSNNAFSRSVSLFCLQRLSPCSHGFGQLRFPEFQQPRQLCLTPSLALPPLPPLPLPDHLFFFYLVARPWAQGRARVDNRHFSAMFG